MDRCLKGKGEWLEKNLWLKNNMFGKNVLKGYVWKSFVERTNISDEKPTVVSAYFKIPVPMAIRFSI